MAGYGQSFGWNIRTWSVISVVLHLDLEAAVLVISLRSLQSAAGISDHIDVSLATSVCFLFC